MIDTKTNNYEPDPTEGKPNNDPETNSTQNAEVRDPDSNDAITSYEKTEHSEQSNYAQSSGDLDKSQPEGHYDNTGTSEGLYETSPDEYYNQQDTEYVYYTDYADTKYVDAVDVKFEDKNANKGVNKRKKEKTELPPYEVSDCASIALIIVFVVILLLIVCVGAILGSQLNALSDDSDELEKNAQEVSEEYGNLSYLLMESGVLEIPQKVAELHDDIDATNASLTVLQNNLNETQSQILVLNADLNELNASLPQIKADIEEVEKDVEQNSENITKLQGKLDVLNGSLDTIEEDITALEDRISRL